MRQGLLGSPIARRQRHDKHRTAIGMESFSVQHAGSINHVHSFHFSSSALELAREVRTIVIIATVGWITVTGIRQWRLAGRD